MDMQKYWGAVVHTMDQLPEAGPYYLISLSTPDGGRAGVVVEIPAKKQAAQLLVANTHRIAQAGEIDHHQADEQTAREQLAEVEMKRKQQFAMPKEMTALLAALAAQSEKPKKEK